MRDWFFAPEAGIIGVLRGSMTKKMKAIHLRIVIGGVILMAAMAVWLYETSFFAARTR